MAQTCTNQQLVLLPTQFEDLHFFSSSSSRSIHRQSDGIGNQVAKSKHPYCERKKENGIRIRQKRN